MDNCIFCEIINGNLPCFKVWEDEKALAFLTIKPVREGHLLLIPKEHEDYFFDLDDETIKDLVVRAKPLAHLLKRVFKPKTGKIAMTLMGVGVPHVHLHLIPFDKEGDVNPENAHDVSKEELAETLAKIKAAD